jgi:hypothetical protein
MKKYDIKKERAFVCVFLFLICLVMAHAVHTGWFVSEHEIRVHPPKEGTPFTPLFEDSTHVPDAYRMAMPALGQFVMRTLHIHSAPAIAAVFDFISGFAACYLFYRLAVDGSRERPLTAILFLAMIQFGMSWVVPWQRLETMPTCLFLALALFSLVRIRRSSGWALVIVGATLVQGFLRTDVPLVLGASMIVMGLFDRDFERFGTRRVLIYCGGVVVSIAAAIQIYLRYVRFPNLHRWPSDHRILTLAQNLYNVHSLINGFVSLLPFILFAVFVVIRRPRLDGLDRLILLASALYLVVWLGAGLLSEARIYVPFMFALSSVAAKVLGSRESSVLPVATESVG